MRVVVLGDIHSYRLAVPPLALVGKRIIGHANLWLTRRHVFDHALMRTVVERVQQVEPDLVLFTGDLTTTALEEEFRDISSLLSPITERFRGIAVPGNHDRYTFTSARVKRMESLLPHVVPQRFPHFDKLGGGWHLLALDGAVPRLFNARGRLGVRQLIEAEEHLQRLSPQDGVVVLCHYPVKSPLKSPPAGYGHKLADSRPLRNLLRHCRARVVYVHGHIHRPWCWQPRHSDHAHITYINAGAPCMCSGRHPLGQGFWQLELPENPRDHISVVHHLPECNGSRPQRGERRIEQWQVKRVL